MKTANNVGNQGDPGMDDAYETACLPSANSAGLGDRREVVIDNISFFVKETA